MGKRAKRPDIYAASANGFKQVGKQLGGLAKKGVGKAIKTAKKYPKTAAAVAGLTAMGNPHAAGLAATAYGAHKVYQHFHKKKTNSAPIQNRGPPGNKAYWFPKDHNKRGLVAKQ